MRRGEREGGGGGEKKNRSRHPLPSAPYFSHSLPVSFPSRKFLETPVMQAISEDDIKRRVVLYSL